MKILQLPTEIAGQANLTAQGLRAIGHESYNASKPNPYGYPFDLNTRFDFPGLRSTRNPFLFFEWIQQFDIFHYHKSPFWPYGLDVKYLEKQKKKFFIEFWGSDIRLHNIERERNPYFISDNSNNNHRKLNRLKFWSDQTNQVIMSDNSADIFLKPFFEKIHIVRQRINTSFYKPKYPNPENKVPKIMHAPTVKNTKGTKYIEEAIYKLEKKGLKFKYEEVQTQHHHKALKLYQEADLIVDQLLMGSHGVFAVEALALGKPVLSYIHDDLLKTYPKGFPVINANPDTIEQVLEEWILSPVERHNKGIQSRQYCEDTHDFRKVAKRLAKIYEEG